MSEYQRIHGLPDTDDPKVVRRQMQKALRRWQSTLADIETGKFVPKTYGPEYCEKRIAYWTAKLMEV
jgi:hypothetical protein